MLAMWALKREIGTKKPREVGVRPEKEFVKGRRHGTLTATKTIERNRRSLGAPRTRRYLMYIHQDVLPNVAYIEQRRTTNRVQIKASISHRCPPPFSMRPLHHLVLISSLNLSSSSCLMIRVLPNHLLSGATRPAGAGGIDGRTDGYSGATNREGLADTSCPCY